MRIFSCIFLLAMCLAMNTALACDPTLDRQHVSDRDESGGGKSSGGGGGG